jgi:transcriptional regulator with XRE-family HTH domain
VISGELGDFIRSRREWVLPADVGLPTGTRRRTPGLRRAELATQTGISIDYLIRLEQGRDDHPSIQVLTAIAQALRLTDVDRDHPQQLATISQSPELCAHARRTAARSVRPATQAILDQLDPAPACVVNRLSPGGTTTGPDRLVGRRPGALRSVPG